MNSTISEKPKVKKPVTIADVARAAGVSKTAASAAFTGNGRLSEATREAVLKAARELRFEPSLHAQRLSTGHSNNMIGLFSLDLDLGVGTQKVKLIQSLISQQGYDVPVYTYGNYDGSDDDHIALLLSNLRRQKPRAIVCCVRNLGKRVLEELARYQEDGGHVVSYDSPIPVECDQVIFDREGNTSLAVRHLLELGHRDIGLYIHGFIEPENPREIGFRRTLAEHEIEVRSEWILTGGLYEEGGAQLAARFIELREKPTALCIVNDQSAIAFIAELGRRGLSVPQDVSVVGHDNIMASCYSMIPLTTVSHPIEAISHQVVELLRTRLSGDYNGAPRQVVLGGELIARESTRYY